MTRDFPVAWDCLVARDCPVARDYLSYYNSPFETIVPFLLRSGDIDFLVFL